MKPETEHTETMCNCIACSKERKIAALQQANERIRKALEEIANSPHQAYNGNAPYVSEHSSGYALGVADGHRCAANIAKAALAEARGEKGI